MKLLPFESQAELVEAANKGVAVSVILNVEDFEPHFQRNYLAMLGFHGKEKHKICTILSEIANMPGHYVVVGKNNQIACGLHGDIFYVEEEEADEDWVD
jgi:hypothetical protein